MYVVQGCHRYISLSTLKILCLTYTAIALGLYENSTLNCFELVFLVFKKKKRKELALFIVNKCKYRINEMAQ